jgi:hypothetical protein
MATSASAMGRSRRGDELEALDNDIERAQRRYLGAIKALAQVRKLGVPAVQVNIGEKQINMAR